MQVTITTPADFNYFELIFGGHKPKSPGAILGWREHLHTIGPPWHLIGNQRSTMKCATLRPMMTKEAITLLTWGGE